MNKILNWDELFMSMAILFSRRSKDPSTQVGAVIVSPSNNVLGCGYNGMVSIENNDEKFPWFKDAENYEDQKYLYVVHSEVNAIINAQGKDLTGSTIYVTLFPCNECAKLIVQSKIKKVVYLSDKYSGYINFSSSRTILEKCNIELVHYVPEMKELVINYDGYL